MMLPMYKSRYNILSVILVTFVLCCGCNRNHSSDESSEQPKSVITESAGITILHLDGYTKVEVKNPWKDGALLQTYILVPKDAEVPEGIDKDATIVRTPIERVVVYSSVHGGVIKELGCLGSIKGVCDAQYFNMSEIADGLQSNRIADVGNSQAPTIEKLVALKPDAIILSPFQNMGYGAIANLKIPIIECADYMENTPLGRAEWIKFFGELYGEQQLADSIFNATKDRYQRLSQQALKFGEKAKVLTEMPYSGVWYVPGGESYMAKMLEDAGYEYPWADDKNKGSLSLDFAQVLAKASDAEYWLIKPMSEMSYSSFKNENALYGKFEAYKQKRVYQCVTVNNTFYQDFPFHPDVLLKELIAIRCIAHYDDYEFRYYKPLNDE